MKRVIQFSRARYLFFGFSTLLFLMGVVGFIVISILMAIFSINEIPF